MTTIYRLTPQARTRTIGDEGVVVLQDDAEVLIANRSGARMLELCRDGATLAVLTEMLCDEFGAPQTRAEADALAFVGELEASGALCRTTEAP